MNKRVQHYSQGEVINLASQSLFTKIETLLVARPASHPGHSSRMSSAAFSELFHGHGVLPGEGGPAPGVPGPRSPQPRRVVIRGGLQ